MTSAPAVDPDLARLAAAHGVATSYEDWSGTPVPVAPAAVVAALAALDVDASTEEAVALALRTRAAAVWGRLLPPVVVARGADGEVAGTVELRSREGEPVALELVLEDGTTRSVEVTTEVRDRSADRVLRVVDLPALPHGWHRLRAQAGEERSEAVVLAAPRSLELPARLDRAWGWMVQLYSLRSAGSWGVGDYADLRTVVAASAAQGAGVLLANPLHAENPVPPLNPSPYSPSSRLFRSPVWLRLDDVPELAAAPVEVRDQVAALRPPIDPERVLRDPAWQAKLTALELLWPRHREGALAAFRADRGQSLEDFGLFCALAERHGLPWQGWPADLRRPDAAGVEAARIDLVDRVAFWCWVQLLVDEQLAAVTEAGRDMPVGVVHDLAVGVDAGGADAWALQDTLALGTTVGAPPDSFNQKGQDWGLPPWRPDRLREKAYAPYRDLVRGMLRHAGGLRIDHVMGLFRLWWVPQGAGAADGTYVSYDADAMLAVLALEASRAGAVVVGEDLGTVEARVRTSLDETGVLGSAVLWFERDADDDDAFLPPARWPALAMASVTTHDLPTAAGFLVEEHVRVRSELGQLGVPLEQERARVSGEREALVAMLRSEGLVDRYDGDLVLAMHGALAASPCRLVLAAFGDAVGDVRQPNLPGTVDEYPNWRLPVADGHGRPQSLEDLLASPGVARLTEVLREGLTAVRYGRPDPVPTRPAREP